jgi:hypothetical protein
MRWLRRRSVWAAILVTTPAFAGFPSMETYLPAVGRTPGQGGAQFYTTVWATNLTAAPVSFTFAFLKQGQANSSSPASFADTLAAGETKVYENVVETKLGLSSAIGAARIVATGEILVSERIYDQAAGADVGDTVGLFFAGVPKSFSISLGQSASIQGINQGGSENFRYNFALVETGDGSPTVNVQLFDGSGTLLGQKAYTLQPYEQLQPNVADLASHVSTINARITATVTGGSGSALLAGAQLANESQDSSGFEMSFRDDLLGGGTAGVTSLNGLTGALTIAHGANTSVNVNGSTITIDAVSGSGTGLTAVAHDNSLAGSGTVSIPLGIANGQVVRSLNGLHDAVSLTAGNNVTLTTVGNGIKIDTASGSGASGVSSLNTLTGALSITSGNGITVTPSGTSIQVAYTGGGGSGLTSVTHDSTLAGAGTGASPLAIAPGGVGTAQLNASGSASGQVLTSTGSGVSWQTPAGGSGGTLTLPFTGEWDSGNSFQVINNGPSGAAAVRGASSSSASGIDGFSASGYGVRGSSNTGTGVIGLTAASNTNTAVGVYGVNNNAQGQGAGVGGANTKSGNLGFLGGLAYGVAGASTSPSGYGVYATSSSGDGVYGSGALNGVYGTGNINGVYGTSSAGTGLYGTSTSGDGVYGSGALNGVYGTGNTYGVNGVSSADQGIGVRGVSTGDYGNHTEAGVKGSAPSSYGLFGDGYSGLYATGSSGTAAVFEGNVIINGNTHTSGAGAVKFDDPADPANETITHAFVASSEMKNIYDGVATLGPSGAATVQLPAWFETLNKDFRYQLTALGTPQAGLFISKKVSNNQFTIAGGVPGAEVSWQVTGVRADPWAKAHPIQVQEAKPDSERGFYIVPELYGQPTSKSADSIERSQASRVDRIPAEH